MLRVAIGKIDVLCDEAPRLLQQQAAEGVRRASWLAGRELLRRAMGVTALPDMVTGSNGKPHFSGASPLCFNISHSGGDVAVLLGDDGEVGCDIERVRPRKNWPLLAGAAFSESERQAIAALAPADRLEMFWQIWTRKEAIVKQAAGSVWQMDTAASAGLFVSQYRIADTLLLALCTPRPHRLERDDFQLWGYETPIRIERLEQKTGAGEGNRTLV